MVSKLQSDLLKAQEQRRNFLQQYSTVQDKQLCEKIYCKYQEDKDTKDIYASGLVVNCPALTGTYSQIEDQIKNIIEIYQITFLVVIDLPDVSMSFEQMSDLSNVLVYKMEKLRGVVNHQQMDD